MDLLLTLYIDWKHHGLGSRRWENFCSWKCGSLQLLFSILSSYQLRKLASMRMRIISSVLGYKSIINGSMETVYATYSEQLEKEDGKYLKTRSPGTST